MSARWFDPKMLSRSGRRRPSSTSIHSSVLITAAKRDCITTQNARWISSALARPKRFS